MSWRRIALVLTGLVAVFGLSLGLWAFQPWKLWVDDKVEDAAPSGAREITVSGESTAPAPAIPSPTAPQSTEAPTTVAPATAAPTTIASPPAPPAPPTTAVPVGSSFVGIDHGTSGTLVLLQDDAGRRFVRFENLDTSNGPDLFVYLSTNPVDGPEGAFDDDYVNLGRLQGNVGSQNYEVPTDVDLSAFASVVIWCDRFNSAFGAAPLA